MNPEVRRGPAREDQPSAEDQTATSDSDLARVPPTSASAQMCGAYAEDLFGGPIDPHEQKIPRRGSAEYLKHFLALPLPNGWKFWSLAPFDPSIRRVPDDVESIWCVDHQGEHRHLFVDRRTGEEYHLDLEIGWSS
jgi:hypothetical protein